MLYALATTRRQHLETAPKNLQQSTNTDDSDATVTDRTSLQRSGREHEACNDVETGVAA